MDVWWERATQKEEGKERSAKACVGIQKEYGNEEKIW